MLKNYVIIKHLTDSGKYLFRVPNRIDLECGDYVMCDTCRGENQLGVCCCDAFLADPEIVEPLFGTQSSKMKYVTGKVEVRRFAEAIEEEQEKEKAAQKMIECCIGELPRYAVPKEWFFFDQLPRNPMRKIERSVLKKWIYDAKQ